MINPLVPVVFRRYLLFALLVSASWAQAREPLPDPLTLDAALALADADHPALETAAARVDAARAGLTRAEAGDSLQIGLEAKARVVEPVYISPDRDANDSSARLYLRKRLYDFGESDALRESASLDLRGREWEYLDSRQQRRLQIMRRYFDVLLADIAYARDNEALAIAYIASDRAKDRNEMGQLSDVELLRLESEFQASRVKWLHSQSQQVATRSRLALALNRPGDLPSNLLMPGKPDTEQPLPDIDALTTKALAGNPVLEALRARVKAAERAVIASKAADGPSIHAEVEAQAYNRATGSTHPVGAGLMLTWPLYDGGKAAAETAAKRAEVRRLRAELAAEELKLRQSVLELRLQLDHMKARLQETAVLADYRELYLDRSRALYEMEVRTDLGDAQVQATAVRYLHAEALFDWMMAKAELDALAGRLVSGPDTAMKENDK